MRSARSFLATTAADGVAILATCALLSACATHTSSRSAGAVQEIRRCHGAPAAQSQSSARVQASIEAGIDPEKTIERRDKIGIGIWENFGLPQMQEDLDLIGARWFYNWRSALPEVAVEGWFIGEDVTLGGTPDDPHVVFASAGADAWISQTAPVVGGRSYDLYVFASGPASAGGGLAIKFADALGMPLSERSVTLDGVSGPGAVRGLVAPPGASAVRIIGWGSSGDSRGLDDIMLVGSGTDVIENGGFENFRPVTSAREDFVPMIWGGDDVTTQDLAKAAGASVVLGFNEPDHPSQSNMSVSQAIELWPELMATGARLGSPATTPSGALGADSWLWRFMTEADARGLRVDFVAVHYYSEDGRVKEFLDFLEKVHAAYDRPIWVTEWGLVDWSDPGRFTLEQAAAFFREGALMMDELDYVERHAWFTAYDNVDQASLKTNLFHDSGDLTPVGEVFVALASDRELFASEECPESGT